MADRIPAYAEALFSVARAEGNVDEVEDELFRFAQTVEGSDELHKALTDPDVPVARRQQIVEDLLGGKASNTTVALVSMVVGAGHAQDLSAIVRELVALSAAESGKEVAEVRSAVELTADQQERLAKALNAATGKQVTVKVVVDPEILGGVVAQVGDTVIDGSVRSQLEQLRNAF